MSLAELVITSVKFEGRSKSEVARDYKISRYWVHQLVKRYETEGEAAFRQRCRRPHPNSRALPLEIEDRIVRLRKELSKKGVDAGAETHPRASSARSRPHPTTLHLHDLAGANPARIRHPAAPQETQSAGTRFQAAQPNERWQSDITHWHLADGSPTDILNILGDHSRYNLRADARPTTTGPDVQISFRRAFRQHGIPASVLTDNGAVFTGKPRGGGGVPLVACRRQP